METRSYYSFTDPRGGSFNRCSIKSDVSPLIVNCAGRFCSRFPFTTDNPEGRLDYYFMYVISGELSVFLGADQKKLSANQGAIFAPNYHYRYSFSGNGELSYLWCHFTGSDAEALLSELGFSPLPFVFLRGDMTVISRFEKLFSIFSDEKAHRGRRLAHAFEGALLMLASINSESPENPLARSLAYVNEFYTRDIRIPELARLENLSTSRYNAVFRKLVGMSPVAYITKLRMQNACELLLSTDLPVKQIGTTVGYSDPHFFSKRFKAHVGVSPVEYRAGR